VGVAGVLSHNHYGGELMVEDEAPQKKKSYESPKISVISLRPEEAVLGACKNSSSAGPVGGTCTSVGAPCMTPGS
jgi:hypothetical protein